MTATSLHQAGGAARAQNWSLRVCGDVSWLAASVYCRLVVRTQMWGQQQLGGYLSGHVGRFARTGAALAVRLSAGPVTLIYMGGQHDQPPATHRPAETPAAIRAVLAANAGPAVLRQYETELDAAFAQARTAGDLTVLTTAVRRWWIEALEWQRDPAGQWAFLARMERYLAEGPPDAAHRITREEFRAQLGV
jgi:hypothetical protein